jgi:aminoglycoside phosphotransferase family enzyme/predicted kinase
VDQRTIIDFLSSPGAHGGRAVERVETHASVVFLAGDTAYKLKRAVRYEYLDFSTPERRNAMCEAEFALNRRFAPQLYRGVVPVTQEPSGALSIDGTGTPVDWLLVLQRFDQEQLCDRLASRGALRLETMAPLGAAIAKMHAEAEPCTARGGAASMRWVIDGNDRDFASLGLDASACAELTRRARAALAAQASRLDARQQAGRVRRCHGDLHLRNIVLLDGTPTPFDAVEFNDDISCIDVWYDFAFLVMDLWRRALPDHANAVFNAYVAASGDHDGLPLLPLFLSCRAAVRAKTSATAARLESSGARRRELQDTASEYLALARRLLEPAPPMLVAIGGLSGTGKSSLARALAPHVGRPPGALIARSDVIRKLQAGRGPGDALPSTAYTPAAAARVYDTLNETAVASVAAGHAAIADAVFARAADRAAIEEDAARAGVPFVGMWLEAPAEVCVGRVEQRRGDASDADAAVVRSQFAADVGPLTWSRIDASRPPADVLAAARDLASVTLARTGRPSAP